MPTCSRQFGRRLAGGHPGSKAITTRWIREASTRRRGVAIVTTAVMLVMLLGLASLTLDVGLMYNARSQLQRAADSASLAAASLLVAYDEGDPITLARAAAMEFTQRNNVLDKPMTLDPTDITFGRAVFNPATGGFDFVPSMDAPNAVRVVVRQTRNSPNGALPLYFAGVFGRHDADVSAEAIAMLVPRDIAVVADLSGSQSDDSELQHYPDTEINLHSVWDNLPGGIDDPGGSTWAGNEFAVDPDGFSPQMAGPAWGYMKKLGFGTETVDPSYDPTTDSGLVRLPYGSNWSNTALRNNLLARGYTASEANAIMASSNDSSGAYQYRTAVALGLARWRSGMTNGLWKKQGLPAGNNNTNVQSNELTWDETILSHSMTDSITIWRNYIDSYMRSTSSAMYQADSDFRYRFGVKTLVNYLLEKRGSNALTPGLAATPHQPLQSVKDAVAYLATIIDSLGSQDQVSLEIYGTTGRHELDLTTDVFQVSGRLIEMQAGHYDPYTNIGAGILRAIEELDSPRARPYARKVMILLTDGVANVACETCGGGDEVGGQEYALEMAQDAASEHIRIFTVSVGAVSDPVLMAEIAVLGGGEHFHAEGSISDYTTQLDAIFQELGGRRPVQLIR